MEDTVGINDIKHLLKNNAANSFDEYKLEAEILDCQISDSNVKNIAVTAVYGAGKSSAIQTYLENFRKDKKDSYVKVELAGFQGKEYNENEVERGILQQLLYSVKGSKLPNSKIERTDKTPLRALLYTLSTIIIIVSCLLLSLNGIGKIALPNHAQIILYVLAFVSFGLMLWAAIHFNRISRIKYKDLEADFSKRTSEYAPSNLINKFLDEVLYFFECTKVDLVIIEDLDRIASHGVKLLVKLRELNTLINNCHKIKRKVTFIYAVRDDIFKDSEEHAKFFDYILSVTPVINPLTAADKLAEKINNENIANSLSLSERLISNVSIFISDMRVLNNTLNDYLLYYIKLHDAKNQSPHKFENDKLFALCLYKNLYPADYAELQRHNSGVLATILNMDRIYVNAWEEVNRAFPRGKGNTPREKDIIQKIRKRHATLAEILEVIEYDKIFLQRKNDIKASLPDAQKKDFDDIWPLLISLIRRSFIDEHYLDYISAIEYHALTAHDMSFVLKTLRVGMSNFDFKFDNVKQALEYMNEEDFSESGIVNFDILSSLGFIRELDCKHRTYKFQNLINTLLSDEISCALLAEFVKKVSDVDLLQIIFDELLTRKNLFVHALLTDNDIESWKKDKVIASLIKTSIDVSKLNYENCITNYCAKHHDFNLCYGEDTKENAVVAFLNVVKPVFEQLPNLKEGSIRDCIIDKRYYQINTNNLREVLSIDLNDEKFANQNYETLSADAKVKSYVDSNITDYVVNVLFDDNITGIGESQTNFDILNNQSTTIENKKKLIRKFTFVLNKVKGLNTDLFEEIVDYDRMEPSWENTLEALMTVSTDKILNFILHHDCIVKGDFKACPRDRQINFFKRWAEYKFKNSECSTFMQILPPNEIKVNLSDIATDSANDLNIYVLLLHGNLAYDSTDWPRLKSFDFARIEYVKIYSKEIAANADIFFGIVDVNRYGQKFAKPNQISILEETLKESNLPSDIVNKFLSDYQSAIQIDSKNKRLYIEIGQRTGIKLSIEFLVELLKNCNWSDQIRLIANRVAFDIAKDQMLQLLNGAGGTLANLANGEFTSLKLSPFKEAKVIIAKVKDLGIRDFYLNKREVKNEVVIRPKANS